MRNFAVIGSLAVLLFTPLALKADDTNLLEDPGFEDQSKAWKDNNWAKLDAEFALDTEVFHGGTTSKRVSLHMADPKGDLQMGQFPLVFEQDQTKLRLKFWMKGTGSLGPVKVIIRDLGVPYTTYFSGDADPEEGWKEYTFDVFLPDSVVGKKVGLIFSVKDEMTVWYDDVSLTKQ